jgi:shikimate dehydrogenase
MTTISGTTRIFPVIGWPVEQVKAPALFNAYFTRHGIDAAVIPLKVPPALYRDTVRMLMQLPNIGGIFVSIPHKPMSLEAVDQVTQRARLAGACNAVYRQPDGGTVGDLIDGEGFVRALDRVSADAPLSWPDASALVVGAGGVGCAIAASLAGRGIGALSIFDTRPDSASDLQARLAAAFPKTRVTVGTPQARGFDLVVNSTPLGMQAGDPIPVDLDGIAPAAIVADCVMKVEMTPLLQEAQRRGCRIQKGREMLIEQAPLYLELFGWPGASSADFRALEAL